MRCQTIYDGALKLLAEASESDGGIASVAGGDFLSRAPYIITSAIIEAKELDKNYRAAHRLPPAPIHHSGCIELDSRFPLCDRFAPAITYYLAAMLIIDENIELSDKFFDKFCDSLATIKAQTPMIGKKIRNVYP